MNAKEANIILRQKVRTELALLHRRLVAQKPQEVLDRAYEFATKSDMVTLINETEFSAEQAKAMLGKPKLLDSLFKEYGNHSSNSMDVLVAFVNDKADEYAAGNQNKASRAAGAR